MAHDFNNLLHVIMGYTEILAKVTESDPVTRELAAPIMDASRKAGELVRQLLLFSRDKTPEMRPVNLREVIENFIRLLGRIMEENIAISSELMEAAPLISGDSGQIEQVLMNLCVNSGMQCLRAGRSAFTWGNTSPKNRSGSSPEPFSRADMP